MTSWESIMSNRNFRQSVVALVLVALLGAPLTSSAAPRRAGLLGERSVSSGLFTWLWELLGGVWAKEGCMIDPFGRYSENGCLIDPNGSPATSLEQTPKNGCRIDPDGVTVCTP
jgi:hypothetical protein